MSTAITESILSYGSSSLSEEPRSRFAFQTPQSNSFETQEEQIRYSTAVRTPKRSERKHHLRVLRRMKGLLMEIQGKNARVVFVEDGQTYEYEMPSERLLKMGINMPSQPFQMDEVEIEMGEDSIVGYNFRPLAKESDAYVEALNFDEDRKQKLELILKKFAKAKA